MTQVSVTYQFGLVFGKSGYGKTSLVETTIEPFVRGGGKVWAIDPNGTWEGVPGVRSLCFPLSELDRVAQWVIEQGPGTLICEDADRYMAHPTQIRADLMTSYRHFQKHIIVIARRPQGVPKDAIANADWLAIFRQRQEGARKELATIIGEDAVAMIPEKPYHYLFCKDDMGPVVLQTRKRPRMYKADIQ